MNADEFVVDECYAHGDSGLDEDLYIYLGKLRVDLDTPNERDQLVFRGWDWNVSMDEEERPYITVYELEDAWEFTHLPESKGEDA